MISNDRFAFVLRSRLWRGAEVLLVFSTLLLGYGYWWHGNTSHEIVGLAFFILIGRHIFIRFRLVLGYFVGTVRLRTNVGLSFAHFALLTCIFILVVSSVLISHMLGLALPDLSGVTARQVHWFTAYWTAVLVGVHIGLHWMRISGLYSFRLRSRVCNKAQVGLNLMIGLVIFIFGVWSVDVLGVVDKLSLGYSIKFWNFKSSVFPFFAHWVGVIALAAVSTRLTAVAASAIRICSEKKKRRAMIEQRPD